MSKLYDAVIVGSGPNGLAAAITVAQNGGSVLVLEGSDQIGGGMRTRELTLPGFRHDVCSAVHPLGVSSPFFRSIPLEKHGLEWIFPPSELAHPLDDGTAVVLERSLEATALGLDPCDRAAYRELMESLVNRGDDLIAEVLRPILHIPRYPILLAEFGLDAVRPASEFTRSRFRGERAQALFAGLAAHSMIPLAGLGSTAIALVLGMCAHLRGWPIPRGGSSSIANALASYLKSLGGEIVTGISVRSLRDLPPHRITLLDITPKALTTLAADRLTESQKRKLLAFRYGRGVFKMDFALSDPVPWKATECNRAATIHLGGGLEEIVISERKDDEVSSSPYVLVAQQSRFDPTRAPAGRHTLWAYCHVPPGSGGDFSAQIEAQIERFAPGFRETILVKSALTAVDMENYNPNYVGGDISAGAMNLRQVIFRPKTSFRPYATPIPNVYLCSSSTPPGPGVHGMAGFHAALAAWN